MTMQTVAWHKECLKNARASYLREKEDMEKRAVRLLYSEARVAEYQAQVDRAVKEGKPGFDSERYNIPRQLRNDK